MRKVATERRTLCAAQSLLASGRPNHAAEEPSHPGVAIRDLCIEPAGLTVTVTAKVLGVSRKALSALLNGHAGMALEMAAKRAKAFGGSVESWVTQQMQYDLAQISKKAPMIETKRYLPS